MGDCFIYYGSSVFKQFEKVNFFQNGVESTEDLQAFDSLTLSGKNYHINEVFLGWSCAVVLAGEKLYYCGFKNDAFGACHILQHDTVKAKVVKAVCGWKEIFILTEYGGCYLSEASTLDLTKVDFAGLKVRDVAAGDRYSVLLTDCGKIISVKHAEVSLVLTPIKMCTAATAVACGKDYVIVLSFDGRVFTYGIGSRGQLGHGDTDSRESPTLVEALDGIRIKSIAAGGWHAAAVSDIGDLYIWGWNESGQLGLPCAANSKQKPEEIVACQSIPRLVDFSSEIVVSSVSCGSRHTAVLTDKGIIWIWGWNGYGQLGTNHDICLDVPSPLELTPGFCALKVTCSYWSTLITGKYSVPQ